MEVFFSAFNLVINPDVLDNCEGSEGLCDASVTSA